MRFEKLIGRLKRIYLDLYFILYLKIFFRWIKSIICKNNVILKNWKNRELNLGEGFCINNNNENSYIRKEWLIGLS